MDKIKVILSTNGPLHLIKSAEFLAPLVDIKVIQGWIPQWWNKFLISFVSKIVKRDLSKSLKKRTPNCLKGKNKSIGMPEFFLWFCRYFLRKNTNIQSAKIYGFLSKKYIKEADIFHVRSGSGLGGAIEKAKKSGMKIVVDHSIAHPAFMEKHLKDEFNKNNTLFNMGINSPFWLGVLEDCNKADCLLVNSNFVKDTFIEQGYNANKIEIVYLGVREDFFKIKKDYSKKEVFKILFTGSFGFRKGGEYILKALQELDKRNFPYEMTVVGSFESAKNIIKKYKPNNIIFTGHILQDDLKEYLSNSDIYLFPSLCEGCASSGMEAMAAGLPIIATRESGLPIIDGENGLIIPSKNEDAIVDAVIKLYINEDLRKKVGIAAAKTISENNRWEQYAENVYNIYKSL